MNFNTTSCILFALAATTVFTGEVKSVPLKPLTDGVVYEKDGKKFETGLYPSGKNEMPAAHRAAGEKLATTIVPRNDAEAEDANGKIVVIIIGHSNPLAYFNGFISFLQRKIQGGLVTQS